ncbi:hypothetical protein [Enterococcus hirae]|uniref:hypothetical protein n=1 Tax=Enterococcus hirae TaxID=1354 RepID=UPI002DBE00B2|nr:hypothetical protein [Enterococcus hirae]MEB7518763.1 hypothetical protein [Enterococcus hirae]
MHLAEITALILVLAPCGKALFEFLTAVVKLIQALIEAKKAKRNSRHFSEKTSYFFL